MHFDGYIKRAIRERDDRARLAYMTAWLHRTKKMPPLKELLSSETKRPRAHAQSWQEQRNIARMLTVLYGGKVIERGSDGS